jgi:hypothetical protein
MAGAAAARRLRNRADSRSFSAAWGEPFPPCNGVRVVFMGYLLLLNAVPEKIPGYVVIKKCVCPVGFMRC